jgi:hypothetical protein
MSTHDITIQDDTNRFLELRKKIKGAKDLTEEQKNILSNIIKMRVNGYYGAFRINEEVSKLLYYVVEL